MPTSSTFNTRTSALQTITMHNEGKLVQASFIFSTQIRELPTTTIGCLGQTQDSLVLRSNKNPSITGPFGSRLRSNLLSHLKWLMGGVEDSGVPTQRSSGFPTSQLLRTLLNLTSLIILRNLLIDTLIYTDQRTSFADYPEPTLNCLLTRYLDTSHIYSFT